MMRTKRTLRAPKAVHATAGALILALPTSAVAFGVDPADALTASPSAPTSAHAVADHTRVGYGRDVVVRGAAPAADAGEPVALEFEPAGAGLWRTVDLTRISRTGRFTLRTALE